MKDHLLLPWESPARSYPLWGRVCYFLLGLAVGLLTLAVWR
jgi:hypothetical protein